MKTNRRKDENGFLHVANCRIMKAGVNGYYGAEIAGGRELGLEPDKLYRVYRPFEEMKRGASTFGGLPVLSEHEPVSAELMTEDEIKSLAIGSVGTDVRAAEPYLMATLTFTDGDAVAEIESAKTALNPDDLPVQLSPCYFYTALFEQGTFEGQKYEIRMTDIRGNHLAKVLKGREGKDVAVADAQINKKEIKGMKRFYEKLAAILPAGSMNKTRLTRLAMDGDGAPQFENLEKLLTEALEEVQGARGSAGDSGAKEALALILEEAITDREKLAQAHELLAQLSEVEPMEDEEPEDEPAMDGISGRLTSAERKAQERLNSRERAFQTVRPLVGELSRTAFDSADAIYRYALRAQGKKTRGLNPAGMRILCETLAENLSGFAVDGVYAGRGETAALLDRLPGGARYGIL